MRKIYTFIFIVFSFVGFSQKMTNDTIQKIDEVIIETNKVKISLQKLPVSAYYLPAQKIEILEINDMADLNGFVPNLFIPDYGSKYNSPIFIRGIGSRLYEPSVGLYVDNIPYFDKGTFNFEFFKIKKIEILRGPQGTLYGRNTLGGLIKIYTPNPEFNTHASFTFNYGNYNQLKSGFHYNQEISEKVAFLIDGAYTQKDGYFTNTYDAKKVDASNTYSTRFKLLYNPIDKFKTIISVNYDNDKQNGYPYSVYNTESQAANPINYNHPSYYKRDLFSIGVNSEYIFPKMDITFSTSYQYLNDFQDIDQDFTENDIYTVLQKRNKNSFVEELNIKSKENTKIKWVTGLFAFQNTAYKTVDVDIVNYSMNLFKSYDQPTTGFAGFGQISIPFSIYEFTAGIRYDYEKTKLNYIYDRTINGNTTNVENLNLDLSFDEILPKISLSINPIDQFSTYISFSKGYKAGGFNSTIEREEDESYKPEYSLNYEVGYKYKSLDKALTASASIYFIDWKDQQITQTVPSGRGLMLKNAGESESYGIELETRYKLFDSFHISLNYGTMVARFIEYQQDDETNFSGNFIPYVPKYTLNTLIDYKLKLKNDQLKFIWFNINYNRFGKIYWNNANTNYQNDYGILNINISSKYKNFSFGFWGKNLLNTTYNTFYFDINILQKSFVQLGDPFQVGFFVKYRIK